MDAKLFRFATLCRWVWIASIAVLLVGCETTGDSVESPFGRPGQFGKSYSLFYTPSDHVKELLNGNDVPAASQVWNAEKSHFSDRSNKAAAEATQALGAALKASLGPKLDAQLAALSKISAPLTRAEWSTTKQMLNDAATLLKELDGHEVLLVPSQVLSDKAILRSRLTDNIKALANAADVPFVESLPDSASDFFASYPVELDRKVLLERTRTAWEPIIAKQPPAGIERFFKAYKETFSESAAADISRAYYQAIVARADGGKKGFGSLLDAVLKTKAAGLPLNPGAETRVRLVEVTSKALLSEGQVEFPIGVQLDLPFAAERAEIDEALTDATTREADVVVLLDVALAKNDRKISTYDKVTSEFQSGTRADPNPKYPAAQADISQAQLNVMIARQNAQNPPCSGIAGCILVGVLHGVIIKDAEQKLQEAMNRLSSTPLTVTSPVYAPYQFNKAAISASKIGTINYYVIDRLERSYVRGTFDVREAKDFVVAYGVRDEDRNKSTHLSTTDTEDKVVAFEKAAVTVPLSKILEQITSGGTPKKDLPSLEAIRAEMLADKNRTLAAVRAKTYDAKPTSDKRFDSVAVVFHKGGSLGTGFFVKDDLILTNYHVIREGQFVELKLFNGSETFGKVVATDVRLDLALIKVQARGVPVTLFEDRSLPLGQTVEAIGHPANLQFSITRGVVSAIREIPSSYAPGGKKIRFVQTDTAINPGNSGGPLFLGDKVIGVNTNKLAATELEGLGFAIHYGEVIEFLEQNNVRPKPNS